MEEVVDADIAEADAEDEDEAAVEVDEAGNMGEEFDLVRVVEKVAKWLGKGLVVDAHVVACEDADKDAGEDTDLCTVREMAQAEQAQSSSLSLWMMRMWLLLSVKVFCLYKKQILSSLMPATNLRGVISVAVLHSSCCQSNSSLHQ